MKDNLGMYFFIAFIVVMLIIAVCIINSNIDNQSFTEAKAVRKEEEIIKNINLAISDFDTINPILSNNQEVQNISKLIYEPLITLTEDYNLEACLATDWAKLNDTTYIIKLRENVTWSDGKKFTGADVKYTIEKLKEVQSVYSSNVQNVRMVSIVDEYTVKLELDKAVPFFEYNLNFPIMCESYYEGEDFETTYKNNLPVGTGNFKIEENKDGSIVLVKNANWWNAGNKNTVLEKIVVSTNLSKMECYSNFKNGNIDLINTSNMDYENYIGTIGYGVREYPGREHEFLALNTQDDILSNLEVRQAISYAIDTDEIVSEAFSNKYCVADFPLAYGSWLNNNDEGHICNLALARKSLENGGWTYEKNNWKMQGKILSLNLLVKKSDENRCKVASIIKQQLEQIGIDVNINLVSDSVYESNMQNKNYQIALTGTNVSVSPDLTTYFGEGNLANYSNEEVTTILQEVSSTTDEDILKKRYIRLKQIYKTEVPYISLYFNKNIVAYSSNLVGNVRANWFNLFYNIESWYKK